ncbi:septum formation initiator family protein [Streptomyces sp. TP-A0356]|uniref:septum formation initiator family protein n=1 Tax=Streptomyces sp. TP-A0356 TaxID=1359208 RepID=UPI0006E2A64A|nr:septum formation initiator family protein [Streptomyces sp. TP-A0356]
MSRRPELRGRAARLARLIPVGGGGGAARTPFVLLVVALLGGGLIALLVLNSALSEGAFELDDLQRQTKSLTDEEQALQRDVDAYSAPDALQRRARELGMVPGGDPAFLNRDGTVRGEPQAAARQSAASGAALRPPEVLSPYPSPKAPSSSPSPSRSAPSPSPSAPSPAGSTAPPSSQPARPSPTHGR